MSATPTAEPVAYAELVRAVLVALVALGWITVNNDTVNTVASALGLVLSWLLSLAARSQVTPVTTAPPEPEV